MQPCSRLLEAYRRKARVPCAGQAVANDAARRAYLVSRTAALMAGLEQARMAAPTEAQTPERMGALTEAQTPERMAAPMV